MTLKRTCWLSAFAVLLAPAARGADISEAVGLFKAGKYADCAEFSGQAIEQGEFSETWRVVKLQAEMAIGRHAAALQTLQTALERYTASVQLRWLAQEVYLHNGKPELAQQAMDEIAKLGSEQQWRFRDAANQIVLGRAALHRGADPKTVLTKYFSPVVREYPNFAGSFIAIGELALDKHDYGLAAENLEKAIKLDPTDPDIHFGLARAYAPSDSKKAEAALEAALKFNPNHVDSLLLVADEHIDGERYDEADEVLERVLKVNGKEPRAWALRAVLAHLRNQLDDEKLHRERALFTWSTNPQVDHLIGAKLSRKYRFAEGAAYQRAALKFDPNYLPAKMQLSQDLLRLGRDAEGWTLADDVYGQDAYNVVAHNLVTLRDNVRTFRTLTSEGFVVRMEAFEAEVYGDRVLDLLQRAKEQLCAKYDVEITEPVVVEIFDKQQDFAIRTFGLPGGIGFLGVCFGSVITMNSPASQGDTPPSWEAVLWHEFCHVVTLQKTKNKMPRWLSEGISVYEERQANPAWGESLNPRYREMMLGDELTPVSKLSGAFLQPASPLHLQFAYYESSLVVEYLIEQYGLETLNRILVDLGIGMPINDALQRYAGSLKALDEEFAAFARQRAEQLAADVDWTQLDLPATARAEILAAWNHDHPNNFWGLQQWALRLIAEKQWAAAKQPLDKLLELYPAYIGQSNAYWLLSLVHRELGDTLAERGVLEKMAELDADDVDVFLRLMELSAEAEDWKATMNTAERMLAVNPLLPAPHRFVAQAAENLGNDQAAIRAYRTLLSLDPLDPAEMHFRLAHLLQRADDLPAAKQHVLRSLEEAPRYRAAHRKLLEIVHAIEENNQQQIPAEEAQP